MRRKKPDEFIEPYREIDWDAYIEKNNCHVLKLTRKSEHIISNQGGYNYEIYAFSPTPELIKQGNNAARIMEYLSYIVLSNMGPHWIIINNCRCGFLVEALLTFFLVACHPFMAAVPLISSTWYFTSSLP